MSTSAFVKLEEIPIGDVTIPKVRARALGDVAELVASIGNVGLLSPICVRKDGQLISGRHRLEACRQLGHDVISAYVVDLDDVQAELAELDENLLHSALSTVERMSHLARKKVLYELLHPETRHGGSPGKAGGGKRPKDPEVGAFVDDAAKQLGRSRSAIAEEVSIGARLAPGVVEALKGTPAANSKRALRALAALPVEEQPGAVERLKIGQAPEEASGGAATSPNQAAIFGDLPQLNAAARGLVAAEKALNVLLEGWKVGPGPDVEPMVGQLPTVIDRVKMLRLTLQDDWTPRKTCACATASKSSKCKTCNGLGWLSRSKMRALGEES